MDEFLLDDLVVLCDDDDRMDLRIGFPRTLGDDVSLDEDEEDCCPRFNSRQLCIFRIGLLLLLPSPPPESMGDSSIVLMGDAGGN